MPTSDPHEIARRAAESAIVRAYRDLLGRAPDPFGLGLYRDALLGGRSIDWMRADIEASPEYRRLPAPVPPAPPGTVPDLKIVGREWRDGDRLYVPRWHSCLYALAHLVHGRETVVTAKLDEIRDIGFNGVRVFAGDLGANQSGGHDPNEARLVLPKFLALARDRGLCVEVSALTGTAAGYDPEFHLVAIADIVQGRKSVVVELGNEPFHGSQKDLTPDRLRAWGRAIFTPKGILWACGAAETDEPDEQGVYATSGGDCDTAHLARGRDPWNRPRRIREIYAISENTGRPSINNEPIGADELDGSVTGKQRSNDPAEFFTMGALCRGFGVGDVHHSQSGLMVEPAGPVQLACARADVAGHAAIESILPGVVGRYKNASHDGSPVARVEKIGEDIIRAYSFVDGDRGATVLLGIKAGVTPRIEWGADFRPVRLVDARTRADDGSRIEVWAVAR